MEERDGGESGDAELSGSVAKGIGEAVTGEAVTDEAVTCEAVTGDRVDIDSMARVERGRRKKGTEVV